MSLKDHFRKISISILKIFLSVPELSDKNIGSPNKILVIRQHNQFGDLLASVSLFRALKETFPNSHVALIVGLQNYPAVLKNKFIDEIFIFENKKLINPEYVARLKKVLSRSYDMVIAPATVAVSLTSCILTGLSKSKIKIGPGELNGSKNDLAFVFNYRIKLDWKKCPDAHVSDFILDIVRPFGVKTKNFRSTVYYDDTDLNVAEKFINELGRKDNRLIIGFHVGAGKPQNKWPIERFAELMQKIDSTSKADFYFTGSSSDNAEINFIKKHFGNTCGYFIDKSIPQLAALISKSGCFITNDTGVMHVAGATETPQISLFGPTNPFNWAPIGNEKYFIRKSERISDISVDDVYNLFDKILEKHLS